MPAVPFETYDQGVFRMRFPDVAAYAMAGNLVGISRTRFLSDGMLTDLHAARVRALIREYGEQHPDDPADAWDCGDIPNGRYIMTTDDHLGGDTFDFSVHLVQSGQYQGKRVLRYKFPGNGTYTNIGWLTKSGEFFLWRRFHADADDPYVKAAEILLDGVRSRNGVFPESFEFVSMSDLDGDPRHITIRVVPHLRCFECASRLASDSEMAVQHCESHLPVVRESDEARQIREVAEASERGVQALRAQTEANRRLEAERGRLAALRAAEEERMRSYARVRTDPLPMCEITRTVVQ